MGEGASLLVNLVICPFPLCQCHCDRLLRKKKIGLYFACVRVCLCGFWWKVQCFIREKKYKGFI